MSTIEKSTITIKTAVIITMTLLSLVTTGITVYFTALSGVEKGFEKLYLEIVEQKNESAILRIELNHLQDQVEVNTATIKAITDFIKPEEPKRKTYAK